MKKRFFLCFAVISLLLLTGLVLAQEQRGSAAEAKLLVDKGYQYIQEHGLQKAVAEFQKPAGPFRKKDLYIAIADLKGNLVCYPPKKASVGKNALFQKDSDGSSIVQKIIDTAKARGTGWVDYKWLHPKTGKTEQKTTYLRKISDNMVMYCGAYK